MSLTEMQAEMRARQSRRTKTRHGRLGMSRELYSLVVRAEDESSDHRCAICWRPRERTRRGLVTDHCHRRMMFRGRLCDYCNTGLGMFRDDPGLLLSAAEYLCDFLDRIYCNQ